MKLPALVFVYLYHSVVSGFFVPHSKMTKEIDEIHQEKHKFNPEMDRKHFKKHDEEYFTEEDSLDYLSKYGYLPLVNDNSHNVFSKTAAVISFQKFANLPETGVIDEETVEKMKQPRCGVKDVYNTPMNYKLGPSKWSKNDLTYRITEFTKDLTEDVQRSELAKAFKYWSDVSPLKFKQLATGNADIMIKFVVKKHGDGYDFDGKGNVLAHAFYPVNGNAHFDDDEKWTSESTSGINLLAVATHEFGHSLGLDHSNVDAAIMAPFYNGYQKNLKLDKDDIEAIQKWYGPKDAVPDTTTPTPTPTPTTAPTTVPTTATPTTTTPTTAIPTTTPPKTTTTTTSQPTTPTLTTTTLTTAATTPANTPPTTSMTTTIPNTSKATQTTTSSTTTLGTTTVSTFVPSSPMTTTVASPTTTTNPKHRKFTPHNFPCPFRFGAIMADESGMSIAFAGSYFVFINKSGHVYPVRHHIRSRFQQGPSYVHAAAYDAKNNSTFLFRNRSVWKYSEGKLIPGFPKYLGIFPLAAVIENGQLMLLTTSYIYHLDKNTMHWLTYPISIRTEYPGIPYYFRAAVSFGHGYVYFFRWRKIYELDIYTGEISQMDC